MPTPQALSPTPPSILAEVTTVSFVGTGYTLNLRIDEIPNDKSHEEVRLVVTHSDGSIQEELTQFMQIRNGDYIGAVTVDRERIESPDPEWLKGNITVRVIPERTSNSNQATAQSQEVTRTPILSPTNTPRPASAPRPSPTTRPTSTPRPTPTDTPTHIPVDVGEPMRESREWVVGLEYRIHSMVNEQRSSSLSWDSALANIARHHSREMAEHSYFNHTNRAGQSPTDRARAAGYTCQKNFGTYYTDGLAENIFKAPIYSRQWYRNGITVSKDYYSLEEIARLVVEGWMDSPGHRQNILNSQFDRQGIGIAIIHDEFAYVTQNFC